MKEEIFVGTNFKYFTNSADFAKHLFLCFQGVEKGCIGNRRVKQTFEFMQNTSVLERKKTQSNKVQD